MPKILSDQTVQVEVTRNVIKFVAVMPVDGGAIFLEVHFQEVTRNKATGEIIVEKPKDPIILSQAELSQCPHPPGPMNPNFFDHTYAGLSAFFHAKYEEKNAPAPDLGDALPAT